MSRTSKHRIAQLFLVVLWLGILISDTVPSVESQSCGNRPQFYNPSVLPPKIYWPPTTTQVVVKMDVKFASMHSEAIQRIIDGNKKWNNFFGTCAFVNFSDFDTVTFTAAQYADPAPLNHVYWQVDDPNSAFNGGVFIEFTTGGLVAAARIKIKPGIIIPDPRYFNYLGTHEIGHTFGLDDCLSTKNPPCIASGLTIMGGHTNTDFDTQGPTACDFAKVRELYCPPTPSPSPTPSPTPEPDWPWPDPFPPTDPATCQSGGWYWNFLTNTCNRDPVEATCGSTRCAPYFIPDGGVCTSVDDYCAFPFGCPPGTVDGGRGCCCVPTPVLIDVAGNGFSLTDAYNGVMFDMGGDGRKEPVAWTSTDNDDAWLVLDRNGNGQIDSAKEMFGNFTEQPHATTSLNGFVALAEFDRSEHGGNGDEKITTADSVFAALKLWQDRNRNGISEQSELYTLPALNIATIELDYKESKKSDDNGNTFSYRAKVKDVNNNQTGRWAWDVTLSANPPPRK